MPAQGEQQAMKKHTPDQLLKVFRRESDGSWTSVDYVELEGPSGRMQIPGGMRFPPREALYERRYGPLAGRGNGLPGPIAAFLIVPIEPYARGWIIAQCVLC
jgi:hypothetical protein